MTTIRDLYGTYTTQRDNAVTRDAARDAATQALADATAAAQQAEADANTALAALTTRAPEGKPYLFGQVIVINLHGQIQELPLGDLDADLDATPPPPTPTP